MGMKIGIIGSGNIGGNLGKHWAKAGHEVLFSSRHPETLNNLVNETEGNAKAVSVENAFEAKADVYLLATPFKAIDKLSELYAGEYGNNTIIDATNPYPERDGTMAQDVRDSNRIRQTKHVKKTQAYATTPNHKTPSTPQQPTTHKENRTPTPKPEH